MSNIPYGLTITDLNDALTLQKKAGTPETGILAAFQYLLKVTHAEVPHNVPLGKPLNNNTWKFTLNKEHYRVILIHKQMQYSYPINKGGYRLAQAFLAFLCGGSYEKFTVTVGGDGDSIVFTVRNSLGSAFDIRACKTSNSTALLVDYCNYLNSHPRMKP